MKPIFPWLYDKDKLKYSLGIARYVIDVEYFENVLSPPLYLEVLYLTFDNGSRHKFYTFDSIDNSQRLRSMTRDKLMHYVLEHGTSEAWTLLDDLCKALKIRELIFCLDSGKEIIYKNKYLSST